MNTIAFEAHATSILPPDFLHGGVMLEKLYESFSSEWVENAAFIIETEAGTVWAAFNDYFLSVGTGYCESIWNRSSIVRLNISDMTNDSTKNPVKKKGLHINCTRSRFTELEQGTLNVWRESAALTEDALSFVCLCATLVQGDENNKPITNLQKRSLRDLSSVIQNIPFV